MTNIEELQEIVNGLKALLDDPHPGLFTWQAMVAKRLEQFTKFYEGE